MTDSIENYKKLFFDKKYDEIISQIENNKNQRSAKILHILGICKVIKGGHNKDIKLSARENFREAYLLEKNTDLGVEALSNFINLNTDFLEIKDSLDYFSQLDDKYKNNINILKAISRVYQFSFQVKKRKEIIEKILNFNPSSSKDWCSYIYIQNFNYSWDQEKFFKQSRKMSNIIPNFNLDKLSLDKNIKENKIKIGFISSDLVDRHSVSYFLKSLLKNINKSKFETFAFSNQDISDENDNEIKNYFDYWYNIKTLDDLQAIRFIREKKIDIAFDLMGVTSQNRIALFKNRISPIQISWLGYCNTTGLNEMDYLITDKYLIKENEEVFYSEKIKKLETIWNTHIGFDYTRRKIEAPSIKKNIFTFGSFNNFNKISDETLECWMSILNKVNNSQLFLKSSTKYNLDFFNEKIIKLGISNKIKILDPVDDLGSHLKLYDEVDLALDTFPYNGVTTTFESLWKNVPVLTLKGYNFNSRCGSTIIKWLGCEYLISQNKDEYIDKAIYLAENQNKLIEIRDFIYNNIMNSPLFDTKNFTNNFEKLLNEIIIEKKK